MRQLVFMITFFLACAMSPLAYGYVFDYNANCSKAYREIMSLHLAEGRATLLAEIRSNPSNLMVTYLSDYEDCIVLLLNCSRADYDQREPHLAERLSLIEKGDHHSPWYRFCKSGIYLHWALISLRMGDLYHQAIYFRKSILLLRDNENMFPAFEYNVIFSGLQQSVAGALPDNYKWLASLFGVKGSVKKGTAQLSDFVSSHHSSQPFFEESVCYYLFTRFYLLSDQKTVWQYLNSPAYDTKDNLLNAFIKASLAIDYRKADAAIELLHHCAQESNYGLYPVFDYLTGIALLNRADTNCTNWFAQYLKKNKSDIFIKDTWQKMAFAWYVGGNLKKAEFCRAQIRESGTARLDADKQAERFAEGHAWPLRELLEARLLIEGGYYNRAEAILTKIDARSLNNAADRAEYYFRLGRVAEESGQDARALEYYQQARVAGQHRREQFAARAALQQGKVYERQGNTARAIASYRDCLDMPAHDFQNSIDNQAKAGLNRVEVK